MAYFVGKTSIFMTRQEHLAFCKHCTHQKFDRNKGIICSLINAEADFEDDCADFSGDRSLIETPKVKKKVKRQREPIKLSSFFINKIDSKSFDMLSLFTPRQGYFFTPIIIAISIALYTIMAFTGGGLFYGYAESLLQWGANFRARTMDGELWRLLTNNFIHMGVINLLINMYALFCLGVILEPIIGKVRFIVAFLLSALMGSVVSVWWLDTTISAGASAAIFGLYAIYLVLLPGNIIEKGSSKKILLSTLLFLAFNALYGVRNSIDGAAHIGGFVSGIILGLSYRFTLPKPILSFRSISLNIIALFFLISTPISLLSYISLDVLEYEDTMVEFTEIEEEAMKIYKMVRYSSDQRCLKEINEVGIPSWEKGRQLIQDLKTLDNLSPQLSKNVDLLLRYCNLRINSYSLMAKSIEEQTNEYKQQQQVLNKKIELIISEIHGFEKNEADSFYDNYDDDYGIVKKPTKPSYKRTLYIVDGVVHEEFNMDDLDPMAIDEVSVLDGKEAVDLYGEKGKEGVVVITTK